MSISILRYIFSYFKKYQQEHNSEEFSIFFENYGYCIDFTIFKDCEIEDKNFLSIGINIFEDSFLLRHYLDLDTVYEFLLDSDILEELDETELVLSYGREILDNSLLCNFDEEIKNKILEYISTKI